VLDVWSIVTGHGRIEVEKGVDWNKVDTELGFESPLFMARSTRLPMTMMCTDV
jgi:hypothetical protein